MSEELRLGEDDADASAKLSRQVLTRVSLALKVATMHRLDNLAMQAPIKNLLETVTTGLDGATELLLQMMGDNFFLNREIIKLDFTSYEAGHSLVALLGRVGAQEIAFKGQPAEAELRTFLGDFQAAAQSPSPQALLAKKWPHISLRAIPQSELDALRPKVDERKNLVRAYANLAIVIGQQVEQLKAGRQVRLAKVRRSIHELADACTGHEALLIMLTRLDAFSGQVRFHLAATTALTVLLARRLRLTRVALSDACMAAAFHDLALDELPKPSGPGVSFEEVEALERVPLRTVLRLSAGALGGDVLERLAVAWEHAQPPPQGPIGYAQLIAVPCVFDRLTRPQAPHQALLPDEALRFITSQAGKRFDLRVVRLFTSVVGVFPVGTTVKLSSGELALVVEVPGDAAQFARPRVKVVRSAQGAPVDLTVDLAAPGETRKILGSVDASSLDLNVLPVLLA